MLTVPLLSCALSSPLRSLLLFRFSNHQPGNSKTRLPLIPPVIGCGQFYLANGFKSGNKVCTTKAGNPETSLAGLDLWVQKLALQYIATDKISTGRSTSFYLSSEDLNSDPEASGLPDETRVTPSVALPAAPILL